MRGTSTRAISPERTGAYANTLPAGREGVENKDINGVVRWDFAPMQSLEFEAGYSRQKQPLRR
ncbi:ferrienterobactin receptor [Enterobacter cloacae]|uniref:Ferrienterobactin receptor n=1 Tax=Enterobacter cloacae TaxID=550 RepID=A0A377M4M7_ENTCL|nr:ferrienterobactin receptor [Enterobacter cloacae]